MSNHAHFLEMEGDDERRDFGRILSMKMPAVPEINLQHVVSPSFCIKVLRVYPETFPAQANSLLITLELVRSDTILSSASFALVNTGALRVGVALTCFVTRMLGAAMLILCIVPVVCCVIHITLYLVLSAFLS